MREILQKASLLMKSKDKRSEAECDDLKGWLETFEDVWKSDLQLI